MASRRFALPSFEEAQQLRQAQDIVHGNLVNMEIEELLVELRVRYGKLPRVERALFVVRETLVGIKERRVTAVPADADRGADAADSDGLNTTICVPRNTTLHRDNTKVSQGEDGRLGNGSQGWRSVSMDFVAPRSVELAGSFLLRSVCRPRCTIDIAVEMPQECFLPKDVLDHRYADKRLLYLSVLAQELRAVAGQPAPQSHRRPGGQAPAVHPVAAALGAAEAPNTSGRGAKRAGSRGGTKFLTEI